MFGVDCGFDAYAGFELVGVACCLVCDAVLWVVSLVVFGLIVLVFLLM